MMSENETFTFLRQLAKKGWTLGLDSIEDLLRRLGQPQLEFKSIHIAGTNGKGSTCAILESILRHAGYKTGLFTSPHLKRVEERIKIDGRMVSNREFVEKLSAMRASIETLGCSYFEALTALAFRCFADHKVDIAIIETGMGGRFDATNVITPLVSVIVKIDYDHQEHLGQHLNQIANEKAGIIKPGIPCLTLSGKNVVDKVLRSAAENQNAPFYLLEDLCLIENMRCQEDGTFFDMNLLSQRSPDVFVNLPGIIQVRNAAMASTALTLNSELKKSISIPDIYQGLACVKWPGRLQILQNNPKIIVDVAHNTGSIRALVDNLTTIYDYNRLIMVVGLLQDKNYREISQIIARAADAIYVVRPKSPRALPSSTLAGYLSTLSQNVECLDDWCRGFSSQVLPAVGKNDLVCVFGSHYLAGEFLDYYEKIIKKT